MSTAAASARRARQRSQYSLYDDIRCTGDDAPQSDLPMEVVCNIFDFANFTCAMCETPEALPLDDQKRGLREEAYTDDQGGLEAHAAAPVLQGRRRIFQ